LVVRGRIDASAEEQNLKRTIWVAAAVVVLLAAAGYWYFVGRGGDRGGVDLVEAFRGAEKRSSLAATSAFSMDPQTILGVTRPSIYIHPSPFPRERTSARSSP
jgi:hypothetical protein